MLWLTPKNVLAPEYAVVVFFVVSDKRGSRCSKGWTGTNIAGKALHIAHRMMDMGNVVKLAAMRLLERHIRVLPYWERSNGKRLRCHCPSVTCCFDEDIL